jgi:twitching motility protein PilT
MKVDDLLRAMTDLHASDLHLKPARPPLLRINGDIVPMDAPPLRPEEIGQMLSSILQPHQKARLERDLAFRAWRAFAATFTCSVARWLPRSA